MLVSSKFSLLGKNKMESSSTPYLLNKKANFESEKLTMQATLYFSKKKKVYQEKPLVIKVLLVLPTETKVAGFIKLDLAKYANYYENSLIFISYIVIIKILDLIEEKIKVLKCPDPAATFSFDILAKVLKSANNAKDEKNPFFINKIINHTIKGYLFSHRIEQNLQEISKKQHHLHNDSDRESGFSSGEDSEEENKGEPLQNQSVSTEKS